MYSSTASQNMLPSIVCIQCIYMSIGELLAHHPITLLPSSSPSPLLGISIALYPYAIRLRPLTLDLTLALALAPALFPPASIATSMSSSRSNLECIAVYVVCSSSFLMFCCRCCHSACPLFPLLCLLSSPPPYPICVCTPVFVTCFDDLLLFLFFVFVLFCFFLCFFFLRHLLAFFSCFVF